MPFCDVSSTLVRVNCNFGFDNSAYLPKPVDAYIKEKGLYCDFKPMVTKLRALQNRDRFEHTYNVVLAGLEIARKPIWTKARFLSPAFCTTAPKIFLVRNGIVTASTTAKIFFRR